MKEPETLYVGIFGIGREPADGQSSFEALRARACLVEPEQATGFIRGDANADGKVDLSDALAILGYLFLGGALDCLDAGDVDDDGTLVITDPIALLTFLFLGGPAPPEPYPGCGPDPTDDELTCESFGSCD